MGVRFSHVGPIKMIKLTLEVNDKDTINDIQKLVKRDAFKDKAYVMAVFEMLPYHEGTFRVKLQFEDDQTFVDFVQTHFHYLKVYDF
jgi:hypothetical protein